MQRNALVSWIPSRFAALVSPLIAAWPQRSRGAGILALSLAFAGSAAAVPLTPLEAGVHCGGDDTIASVRVHSPHRVVLWTTFEPLV